MSSSQNESTLGEGGACSKTNKDKQGGAGGKTWESWANVLFECSLWETKKQLWNENWSENSVYYNLRKVIVSLFLAITFLIEILLPLGLRTGNLLQKWAKFLCYMLHFLKKARPSFFQTSKFKLFFTFLQKFLIIHPQKENTVLMNTRLYSLKIRLEEVSTLRETCFRT